MNFLLFCLSLIIVPHGITDIVVSYETNTINDAAALVEQLD